MLEDNYEYSYTGYLKMDMVIAAGGHNTIIDIQVV